MTIEIQTGPLPPRKLTGRLSPHLEVYHKAAALAPGQWIVWPNPPKSYIQIAKKWSLNCGFDLDTFRDTSNRVIVARPKPSETNPPARPAPRPVPPPVPLERAVEPASRPRAKPAAPAVPDEQPASAVVAELEIKASVFALGGWPKDRYVSASAITGKLSGIDARRVELCMYKAIERKWVTYAANNGYRLSTLGHAIVKELQEDDAFLEAWDEQLARKEVADGEG